jgi:ATP-dependent DNA helicase RecQ
MLFCNRQLSNVDTEMKAYILNFEMCRRKLLCDLYSATTTTISPQHLCCDFCEKLCLCCEDHTVSSVGHSDSVYDTGYERLVTDEQQAELRESLMALKRKYDVLNFHVLSNPEISHGFTQAVVDSIVDNAEVISCVDDLLEICNIWSSVQATDVMDTFESVFSEAD